MRLRKASWALIVWTVLCGLITIVWMAAGSQASEPSDLPLGTSVQVDDEFRLTLLSTTPARIRIENTTTSNAYFDYSDVTMIDDAGAEHEPAFVSGQIGDTVPARRSIEKSLDFGNIGGAAPASYHWECDACDAGEAIGLVLVFLAMGAVYWFGMLVLFIVWLVSRPPRTVIVRQE